MALFVLFAEPDSGDLWAFVQAAVPRGRLAVAQYGERGAKRNRQADDQRDEDRIRHHVRVCYTIRLRLDAAQPQEPEVPFSGVQFWYFRLPSERFVH